MTNMHSTQTKKSYRKPQLKQLGKVSKLTKGKLGSSFDGAAPAKFSKFG